MKDYVITISRTFGSGSESDTTTRVSRASGPITSALRTL